MNDKVKEALRFVRQQALQAGTGSNYPDAYETLRAHIEGLEAEARRYRWLRERIEIKREEGLWWWAESDVGYPEDADKSLDAAIDAAMRGEGE